MVHTGCLKLIGQLLKTNQIALLIDIADTVLTNWINKTLMTDL